MKTLIFRFSLCLALSALAMCPTDVRAQSQQEMNRAAAHDFEVADAQLNKVYAQLLGPLDETGKEKLRTAQRAWVQFREAEAAFAADSERGGTLAPLMSSARSTELTKQRIADFKKMLKGE